MSRRTKTNLKTETESDTLPPSHKPALSPEVKQFLRDESESDIRVWNIFSTLDAWDRHQKRRCNPSCEFCLKVVFP
jgi:hypothetical protein